MDREAESEMSEDQCGKRSENEPSSSECDTETESPVADTSDFSASTDISDEPGRILFRPDVLPERRSQTSSTASTKPSFAEWRVNGNIPAEYGSSVHRQASPFAVKNQIRATTAQTSWGTLPVVKDTTVDDWAGSIVASHFTQKSLPSKVAGNVSAPLYGSQQHKRINRSAPQGQTMLTGTKVSTPREGTLPTQAARLPISNSQLSSEETVSNVLSQYVPWSDGQEEYLLSGATFTNKEVIDEETNFDQALREAVGDALFKFPRTQLTNSSLQFPRASHTASAEATPPLFLNKSHEDTTATPRVHRSHLKMFSPSSPTVRQPHNFNTPQGTPPPVQDLQQERSPRSNSRPTVALINEFGRLSTSQYLTPPLTPSPPSLLLKKQGSHVGHPQSWNSVSSPLLHEGKFNLPQITPSVVQALPQQRYPDLSFAAVAHNHIPEMMGSHLHPTVPSAPNPRGLFAVQGDYPWPPPLPACRTMPPPTRTTHGSPTFPHAPLLTSRWQQVEQNQVGNRTPQSTTAASRGSEKNSRTSRRRAVPLAPQSSARPTLSQVKAALQQYRAQSKRYQERSFEKMFCLLSSLEDCDRVHRQAYSTASHGIVETTREMTLPHIPLQTTEAQLTEQQSGYLTPHLPDTPPYIRENYQQAAHSTVQYQAAPPDALSTTKSTVFSAMAVLQVHRRREARLCEELLEKMQSFVMSLDDNDQTNPRKTPQPHRTKNQRRRRAAKTEKASPSAQVQPKVAQSEQPRRKDVATASTVAATGRHRRNESAPLTHGCHSPESVTGEAPLLQAVRHLDNFENEHRLFDLEDRALAPRSQMRSESIQEVMSRQDRAQGHQGLSQEATHSGNLETEQDGTQYDIILFQPPASMESIPWDIRMRAGRALRANADRHLNCGNSASIGRSSSPCTAAQTRNPM